MGPLNELRAQLTALLIESRGLNLHELFFAAESTARLAVVVLIGIAIGVPAAWIVSRLATRQLTSLLFRLSATDPLTMTVAAGTLLAIGMIAAWLPALRASRIDPNVALRAD